MSKNVWHAVKMLLWGNLQINAYMEKKKENKWELIFRYYKQETKTRDKAEKAVKDKRVKEEWATHGALLVGKCQMHVACTMHKTSATVFGSTCCCQFEEKKKAYCGWQ